MATKEQRIKNIVEQYNQIICMIAEDYESEDIIYNITQLKLELTRLQNQIRK